MTTSSDRPKRIGNYKPGPGRPPGAKNRRTLALQAALEEATAALPEVFDGDAHAFLASVYKNPAFPIEVRILAAGKALRVEKPALSSTQSKLEVSVGMADRLKAARMRVIGADTIPGMMPTVIDGDAVVVDVHE